MPAQAVPRMPVAANPPRLPGSVRRTSQVKMSWEPPGLVLDGTARDILTAIDASGENHGPSVGSHGPSVGSHSSSTGSETALLSEASVTAGLDVSRSLISLEMCPTRPAAAVNLAGAYVGSGFRALVRSLLPGDQGTPLGLLLDDLPGAALISGYVHLRSDMHAGRPAGETVPASAWRRMADICSGWRAGGTAMTGVAAGKGLPAQDCPPAPDLDSGPDPLAWQPMERLPVGTMRRRRRIDVWSANRTVDVDAMFRDAYGEPDGTEVVLHEYSLTARLLASQSLEIESIEAVPRVLPFGECPLAAEFVGDLVGVRVGDLREVVPERLAGIRSCTHLNDLLRVLADVATLVTFLPGD